MTKLNYMQIKQENTQLCWQAVTNIFSMYYRNELYFVGNPGENVQGDVVSTINLAIQGNLHDIDIDMNEIARSIQEGDLLYACLDYFGTYHAVVIVGENGNTFCIYDPYDGYEHWYSISEKNVYRDTFTGNKFRICNIAKI